MELQFNHLHLDFLYGLSFYTMGVAIALQSKKSSTFRLAQSLSLLAAFAFFHSLGSWGDMFIPADLTTNVPADIVFNTWKAVAIQRLFESISFFFLFCFGAKLISDSRGRGYHWFILPFTMFLAWLVEFIAYLPQLTNGQFEHWVLTSESWASYLLAFPAGIYAAYGLYLQLEETKRLNVKSIPWHIWGGIISFLSFSVFEGLVVPHQIGLFSWLINTDSFNRTVGLPVEFFKMGTAVGATYCIICLLMIFNLEQQRVIAKSRNSETIYRERVRFACDLHDDVIQSIYAVGLELQTASYILDQDQGKASSKLNNSIQRLNEIIHSIRLYIQKLEIEDKGEDLKMILANTVEQVRTQTGLEIEFSCQTDQGPLFQQPWNDEWSQQIGQIVREALHNVAHHAHTSFASVNVLTEGDSLVVTVADSGQGFTQQKSAELVNPDVFNSRRGKEGGGRGLKNMYTRARLLGGTVQIDSKKDTGTRVKLSVPLSIKPNDITFR